MGNFFDTTIINPIINALIAVYYVINSLNIPYAFGFSIISLTILARLLMYPLMTAQIKSSKKMQELGPEISKVKDKYKGDNKRIQQETMRIYKESGVNPAAGCLPILIQLPLIMGLYTVLIKLSDTNTDKIASEINNVLYFNFLKINHVMDLSFFGIPLGENPSSLFSSVGVLILLVPLATGFFQFIQSKMMIPHKPTKEKNKVAKKEDKKEDFATTFQSQALYIFPVMIGVISFNFPISLSLYWNTFTIFGIIQQYRISGLGGAKVFVDKIYGQRR